MTHKLLLADDSVTIQRVIELTFADEDFEVITVGDGQAAIDRLESDPPDIVLADIDMPRRDGYEVATYVKNRPKLAHIPVVLLTGAFEPIDQARATAAGSSDVLAKPFEPQMVINRVKQLLGKKREEAVDAAQQEVAAPPQMRPPSAPRPPARSSMAMNDEHATQQDQPARPTPGQNTQDPVSLDDYFDQLDAAFSNLQPAGPAVDADTMRAEEDWIDSEPEPVGASPVPPPPRPIAAQPQPQHPEPLVTPPAATPGLNRPWAPAPSVIAAPPPVVRPPVPAPPPRPVPAPTPIIPTPVITDEVIDEVVVRVLQRLTDRIVRETVTEIVSETAERLVREAVPETVSKTAERLVLETVTEMVPKTAERVVRETVPEMLSKTAERLVRETLTETVSKTAERLVGETVTEMLPETAERVVRETVTETVSTTAERLVQIEIERIKSEAD